MDHIGNMDHITNRATKYKAKSINTEIQ